MLLGASTVEVRRGVWLASAGKHVTPLRVRAEGRKLD